MDRHKLWRDVAANYKGYEETAPEGYEPRVRVYIAGRDAPVEVGQVITQRADEGHEWVALLASSMERLADTGSTEKGYPDDVLVFAHVSTIIRVEIVYVPKEPDAPPGRQIGFTVSEEPADG